MAYNRLERNVHAFELGILSLTLISIDKRHFFCGNTKRTLLSHQLFPKFGVLLFGRLVVATTKLMGVQALAILGSATVLAIYHGFYGTERSRE